MGNKLTMMFCNFCFVIEIVNPMSLRCTHWPLITWSLVIVVIVAVVVRKHEKLWLICLPFLGVYVDFRHLEKVLQTFTAIYNKTKTNVEWVKQVIHLYEQVSTLKWVETVNDNEMTQPPHKRTRADLFSQKFRAWQKKRNTKLDCTRKVNCL